MRDTKIVATLGPASSSEEVLRDMIRAGVNVVRINFSHGSAQEHIERVSTVRAIAEELGVHIGVLADLQGPKIRISKFEDNSVFLSNGSTFIFDKQADVPGDVNRVGLDFPDLIKDVQTGDILLLDDGKIRMRVENNTGDALECIVEQGGKLSDRKGINKLGGGLSAAAIGAALWWVTPFTPVQSALLSLLIVLCGFLGGLALSATKRSLGAKDWGTMIEGHGGALDRLDSVVFAAPVFFHVVRYGFQ